ncbi:MAG: carbohydrate ABC transporter permease [Spirochaetales bacterium]|nr:carbohydrate ABC transporter permease [Spirochaetales bacterium]MBQ7281953.1 carbohydrate ABC transporter permease [Spirochaetales bacterium]MBQ9809794.1 carbohydrate ABC transporter permease [Spirochaetales bacterium]MBR0520498.1 carbohydrate ABC transporter permease [Spirochaetales bacterium]
MNNQFVGKVKAGEIITYIVLILLVLFTIFPILFMLTASFMDAKQILAMPFKWIPSKEYFTSSSRTFMTNFVKAIRGNNNNNIFFTAMINSLLVAITCAVTTVFFSALCGYGLAKFRFKGRNVVFMAIMSTMMIPFEAIMIPLYMVTRSVGLMNTLPGLIVPFAISAFGVFQMRQYLLTFPSEFLDASRVDGLREFGIFLRIVLPNSTPVIATLGILSFRNQWDNLLWPMLCAQAERLKTLPLYIAGFAEEKQTDEGALMACAFLASIPMFILFFTLSKYFLGGAAVFESRKG